MTTAERIKAARVAAGLTQKQLGEKMGLTLASISQYESGKRNPKLNTLQRFADALEITVEHLLGQTETQKLSFLFESKKGKIKYSDKLTTAENELIILVRDLCGVTVYIPLGEDDYTKDVDYFESEANTRLLIDFILRNADMLRMWMDARAKEQNSIRSDENVGN